MAARRPVVGGNWKMNTDMLSAVDLAQSLVRVLPHLGPVDVVLFPPFTNLQAVRQVIEGTALQLGGQNVFWRDSGAFTGEISAPMLRSVGCDWVLVGHSERRRLLGESSVVVNHKLHVVLRHGLSAIVAVGETQDERHSGQMEAVLADQLRESLAEVLREDMDRVVLAYEPVWAIGTGETATPDQAQEAHSFIRGVVRDLAGDDVARALRIQYGGSVTAANAATLMAEPDIDGALVGGASLKPDEFAAIVAAASP